jgi:tetratricopeptide (TPR) repeat protein
LPDALVARASYLTYVKLDAAGALPDLEHALEQAPNDADAHNMAGLTARRLGRFDTALAHFRETAHLEPNEPAYGFRVAETLEGLGRYDEAAEVMLVFGRRFPQWHANAELARFRMRFMATGAVDGWLAAHARLAAPLEPVFRTWHEIQLRLALGDLAGLAAYIETAGASEFEDPLDYHELLAALYSALGDAGRARSHLQRAVDDMTALRAATYEGAVALLLLGRPPDQAIRVADEAVRQVPETRDAVNGPTVAVHRAWVLIRSGGDRADEGYAELERLLGKYRVQPRAYSITPLAVMLREDPRADRIVRAAIARQDAARARTRTVTSPAPAADHRS